MGTAIESAVVLTRDRLVMLGGTTKRRVPVFLGDPADDKCIGTATLNQTRRGVTATITFSADPELEIAGVTEFSVRDLADILGYPATTISSVLCRKFAGDKRVKSSSRGKNVPLTMLADLRKVLRQGGYLKTGE